MAGALAGEAFLVLWSDVALVEAALDAPGIIATYVGEVDREATGIPTGSRGCATTPMRASTRYC